MIKEACIENFTEVKRLAKAGANRFELCDNLAVGGTTPSAGVITKTLEYCAPLNIPVVVMIRPRGGDFVYDTDELDMMQKDIEIARDLGATHLIFGCLTPEGKLDVSAMNRLVQAASGLDLAMHMAFDYILDGHQEAAIDYLIEQGFSRVLTHGGLPELSIFSYEERIKKNIAYAKGKLDFLLGGGVSKDNCEKVCAVFNPTQVHGTKIV